MTMTFYYAPMSTASVTNLILEELGLAPKVVKVDIKAGDTKKPDFLRINPNGKVPVLVHDDIPIFESAAITMHLGEMYGVEKKLYPAPGPKRAELTKWLVWAHVTLNDAVYRWARQTQDWMPPDERNAKAAASAEKEMHELLAIFDKNLQNRKFLGGNDYSIVDGHIDSLVGWFRMMKIDFAPYPNINAWSARIEERPAVQKVNAAEMAAMGG